jgi:hypothetical protein
LISAAARLAVLPECIQLAAESASLFQDFLDARDALNLTSKNDRYYTDRREHLKTIKGRLREARKREQAHEETHQDEFS